MKRIYFRGGQLPYEYVTPERALNRNYLGSNSGNLLYQFSILKALMTSEEDVLVANYYEPFRYSPEYVNENFDVFIIPLADAFRDSFVTELRQLTEFVKQLKIPCVVTGVGLRGPYEPNFYTEEYKFNNDVKEFMKAVLEKSAIVGVRGQITADYLSYLGFREDKDFMVIGCPSLYSYGKNLRIRRIDKTENIRLAYQPIHNLSYEVSRYMQKATEIAADWCFIGQMVQELRYIYLGAPFAHERTLYPCNGCTDEIYQQKKAIFFLNATTWIEYLKDFDLLFGARMHGSIAALLAGTPALVYAYDGRIRELVEYHKLNAFTYEDLKEYSITELIQNCDFEPTMKIHSENFERFLSFLKQNELSTIYEEDHNRCSGPMDDVIKKSKLYPPVRPLDYGNLSEVEERFQRYFGELDIKIERLKNR
ncbi:MAG: polysaccharide pyruvyl transferase family protein [Lachnospiraceae bacterium]